ERREEQRKRGTVLELVSVLARVIRVEALGGRKMAECSAVNHEVVVYPRCALLDHNRQHCRAIKRYDPAVPTTAAQPAQRTIPNLTRRSCVASHNTLYQTIRGIVFSSDGHWIGFLESQQLSKFAILRCRDYDASITPTDKGPRKNSRTD